jgi:hypothetical protein
MISVFLGLFTMVHFIIARDMNHVGFSFRLIKKQSMGSLILQRLVIVQPMFPQR